MDDRHERILAEARTLVLHGATWPRFSREVFGPDGLVQRLFSEDRAEFLKSAAFRQLKILRKLCPREPMTSVLVRIPKSEYEQLRQEALDNHTSLSGLCAAKLLSKT